jgi:predicted GTPase
VDYGEIVACAQAEADLIVWDGGNNDFPFLRPDLHIVLVDALRPGHELGYHPGEAALRMADIVVIAKADAADPEAVVKMEERVHRANPRARVLPGGSPAVLDDASAVRGRRAVVVEDGPTITHGGMAHGAGYAAALEAGAVVVDPRPWAKGEIADVYRRYSHIGSVLPAMGYSKSQIGDLGATLNAARADVIITGTPVDLRRLLHVEKPVIRARYDFAERESPGLADFVDRFMEGLRERKP